MAQPPPYNRVFNFSNYQTVNPAVPLPAPQVDAELNRVKRTFDATLANLAKIQRDDGAVMNRSIGFDQLKPEINGFGASVPTAWQTATSYIARQTVYRDAKGYVCNVDHVSGVFATDLAAGKWSLFVDLSTGLDAQLAALAGLTGVNGSFVRWIGEAAAVMQAIVGTVSQSGGVPNGALIERNVFVNGEYARFADGTQLCWLPNSLSSGAVATASGSSFLNDSGNIQWSFPVAFVGAPVAIGTNGRASARWVSCVGVTTTTASFRVFATASSAASIAFDVFAIGRWV